MKTVGLIGCAHIHTPDFIKRMVAREDIRVASVWDWQAERSQKAAETLGAVTVASPDMITENPSVDAVVICSETNRHEELVRLAVEGKKNLYVEKPLGYRAADAWKMAEAIEKAGLIFQTGYFMRGQPIHLFLKDMVAKGAFGKISRFRHVNCHGGSLYGWFDTDWRWMADPTVAGCGAFGDLGTHSLDIMLWILGQTPEKVTATIQNVTNRYPGCDENGEGIMKFADGTIASLAAGWVDYCHPITLNLSGTEGHACVVNGQLYFSSKHVEGADGKTPWTKLPEGLPHAFELFLDAINGKDVPLVTPREAAMRNAVMEAMYASASTWSWKAPVLG